MVRNVNSSCIQRFVDTFLARVTKCFEGLHFLWCSLNFLLVNYFALEKSQFLKTISESSSTMYLSNYSRSLDSDVSFHLLVRVSEAGISPYWQVQRELYQKRFLPFMNFTSLSRFRKSKWFTCCLLHSRKGCNLSLYCLLRWIAKWIHDVVSGKSERIPMENHYTSFLPLSLMLWRRLCIIYHHMTHGDALQLGNLWHDWIHLTCHYTFYSDLGA